MKLSPRRRVLVIVLSMIVGFSLTAPVLASAQATDSVASSQKQIGDWSLRKLASDKWEISWRSPKRLPVTSDRPQMLRAGSLIGTAVVRQNRVVSTVIRSEVKPSLKGLSVVLSGRDVSKTTKLPTKPKFDSRIAEVQPSELLDFDPAEPGNLEVESADYTGPAIEVEGFAENVEFVGHVVEPKLDQDVGLRPVVLFLHGRHEYCYSQDDSGDGSWPCKGSEKEVPSHLGYDYLQKRLASQGYFTVSVRANGINAQDWNLGDGGAAARAKLVKSHLDYWTERAQSHQLDLDQVVLVGHSRGGEGVARAAINIGLNAPYRIVGTVLLAPTNFGGQAAPYVPTVSVLPYCDGDVYDLQGQRYTDIARDFRADDTALRSSVLVMGANHNYFNSEWTPGSIAPSNDDWWGDERQECGVKHPKRLSAAKQRSVGTAYVTAAVQLFTGQDSRTLALFDGSAARVASAGSAVVYSHAVGTGRSLRVPGVGTSPTSSTMDSNFCRSVVVEKSRHSVCGRGSEMVYISPHLPMRGEMYPERNLLELSWSKSGQVGGLYFDRDLNVSGRTLQIRSAVDPVRGPVAVKVRLTDATGASADFTPQGGAEVPVLNESASLTRIWGQSLNVEPTGATLDLNKIRSVELVSQTNRGRVWVLDVAAVSPGLPSVPQKRLPLVSLGKAKVMEGNSRVAKTARVPFSLNEPVAARSTFTVRSMSYGTGQPSDQQTVHLAPGQTHGTIAVDYVGDKLPSIGGQASFDLSAWAISGVMTDNYSGSLTIVEDDPLPTLTLKAKKRTVKEGQNATWEFKTSAPLAEEAWLEVMVLRGPTGTPALTGGDVTRRWGIAHGVLSRKLPLHKQEIYYQDVLRAGETKLLLEVPIAKDKWREGREQITLRVQIGGSKLAATRTIYVAPSRQGR